MALPLLTRAMEDGAFALVSLKPSDSTFLSKKPWAASWLLTCLRLPRLTVFIHYNF